MWSPGTRLGVLENVGAAQQHDEKWVVAASSLLRPQPEWHMSTRIPDTATRVCICIISCMLEPHSRVISTCITHLSSDDRNCVQKLFGVATHTLPKSVVIVAVVAACVVVAQTLHSFVNMLVECICACESSELHALNTQNYVR